MPWGGADHVAVAVAVSLAIAVRVGLSASRLPLALQPLLFQQDFPALGVGADSEHHVYLGLRKYLGVRGLFLLFHFDYQPWLSKCRSGERPFACTL